MGELDYTVDGVDYSQTFATPSVGQSSTGGGSSWSDFIQKQGAELLTTAANYNLAKMQVQQLGQRGYYTEGQASTQQKPAAQISPLVMLMMAGLLMMMMKD